MPKATLSLTQASIIWRPGHKTRLTGYGIVSAVAYDGTQGIMPVTPLPPIPFRRLARSRCDLLVASEAGVGDDGLLISTFPELPPAVGWVITLTLTSSSDQAKKVVDATLKAAEVALSMIPGMAILEGVAKVAGELSNTIHGIRGARNVGTWINSESDAADLRRDWRLASEQFKARFELDYDVDEAQSDDE